MATSAKSAAADLAATMQRIGEAARAAAAALATAPHASKDRALNQAAAAVRGARARLIDANALDIEMAKKSRATDAFIDRVTLDDARVEGIARGLEAIAAQPDPVGHVKESRTRPNGLEIARVAVPFGVVGIIYEARPNVTADAGGLCLKSGNAAILRGGAESFELSKVLVDCLHEGLRAADLPEAAVQLVPTRDREAVGHMLTMTGTST